MSDFLGGEYLLHGRDSFLSKLQKRKETEEASTPVHRYSTRESRGALSPSTPPSAGSLWVEQEASEAPIPLKGYYAVLRWEHLPEVCRVGHDFNAGADPYGLTLGAKDGYDVLMKRQAMPEDLGHVSTVHSLAGPWGDEVPPSLLAMMPVHTRPVASIPSLFHRILCLLQFALLASEGRDIVPTVDKRILKSTQRKLPATVEPVPGLALAYKACHPGAPSAVSTAGLSTPLFDVNGDFCRFDHPVSADKRQVLVDAQGHEYVVVACRREHVQLLYSGGPTVAPPQKAQRGRGPARGRGRRGNRVKTTITTEDYIGEGGSSLDGVLTKAAVCPHAVSVYYYTTHGVVCVGGREVLDMPCTCGYEARAGALEKDLEKSKEKEKRDQQEGVIGVDEDLVKYHDQQKREEKEREKDKAKESLGVSVKGEDGDTSAAGGAMVDEEVIERTSGEGGGEKVKDEEGEEEDSDRESDGDGEGEEEEERRHYHETPAIAAQMLRGVYIHPYVRDIVNVENVSTHGTLVVNGGIGGHYHANAPTPRGSAPASGSTSADRGREETEGPRTPRTGVGARPALSASGGLGVPAAAMGLGLGVPGPAVGGTPQAKRGAWTGAPTGPTATYPFPGGPGAGYGYAGPALGTPGWSRPGGVVMGMGVGTSAGMPAGPGTMGGMGMGMGVGADSRYVAAYAGEEEAEEGLWEDVGEVDDATKALLDGAAPRSRRSREGGGAADLLTAIGIAPREEEKSPGLGAAAGILTALVRGSPMVQALLRHTVSVVDAYSRVHRDRAAVARRARERAEAEAVVLRKTLAEVRSREERARKDLTTLRERVNMLEQQLAEATGGGVELGALSAKNGGSMAPGMMSDSVLASPSVGTSGARMVTITSNSGILRGPGNASGPSPPAAATVGTEDGHTVDHMAQTQPYTAGSRMVGERGVISDENAPYNVAFRGPVAGTSSSASLGESKGGNYPRGIAGTGAGLPASLATTHNLSLSGEVVGAGAVHEMLLGRMGRVRARGDDEEEGEREKDREKDREKMGGKRMKVTTSSTSKGARSRGKGKGSEGAEDTATSGAASGQSKPSFLTASAVHHPPRLPPLPHLDASITADPWRQALPPASPARPGSLPAGAVAALPVGSRAAALTDSPVARTMVRIAEAERDAAQQRAIAQMNADATTAAAGIPAQGASMAEGEKQKPEAGATTTTTKRPQPEQAPATSLLSAPVPQMGVQPTVTPLHTLLAPFPHALPTAGPQLATLSGGVGTQLPFSSATTAPLGDVGLKPVSGVGGVSSTAPPTQTTGAILGASSRVPGLPTSQGLSIAGLPTAMGGTISNGPSITDMLHKAEMQRGYMNNQQPDTMLAFQHGPGTSMPGAWGSERGATTEKGDGFLASSSSSSVSSDGSDASGETVLTPVGGGAMGWRRQQRPGEGSAGSVGTAMGITPVVHAVYTTPGATGEGDVASDTEVDGHSLHMTGGEKVLPSEHLGDMHMPFPYTRTSMHVKKDDIASRTGAALPDTTTLAGKSNRPTDAYQSQQRDISSTYDIAR